MTGTSTGAFDALRLAFAGRSCGVPLPDICATHGHRSLSVHFQGQAILLDGSRRLVLILLLPACLLLLLPAVDAAAAAPVWLLLRMLLQGAWLVCTSATLSSNNSGPSSYAAAMATCIFLEALVHRSFFRLASLPSSHKALYRSFVTSTTCAASAAA